MCLTYRQQYRLLRIEAGLLRSDPHLGAMFGMFGRLYRGEGMPARENAPSSHDRFRRTVAWTVAALIVAAAGISVLLRAASALTTALRRASSQPSAPRPRTYSPQPDSRDEQDPADPGSLFSLHITNNLPCLDPRAG